MKMLDYREKPAVNPAGCISLGRIIVLEVIVWVTTKR
jgi:hypothetical protein